ncbi:MAG TPA: EAL domain-containing protein [Frankiaceae bacterium]|nr:EAL domain-containing protein [Frankiaceae bacterium]
MADAGATGSPPLASWRDARAIPVGPDAAPYAALLDITFDLSCLLDQAGRISYASPSVNRLLGYSPAELHSLDLFGCVHPEDREALQVTVGKVLAGPEPVPTTCRVQAADGTYRLLEVTAVNLRDDPAVRGIALAARDLTDEQTARRQAETVADQLRVIVDNSPVIVFSLDAAGIVTSARGRELEDLGIDADTVVGSSIFSLGPRAEAAADAVRRALAGEDVDITLDMQGRRFDLRYRPVREGGRITGVFGVGTDISAAAEAMDLLRTSEGRWRSLVAAGADARLIVETTGDGIALVDATGRATYVNHRMSELSGVPHEQLMSGQLTQWLDDRAMSLVHSARERRLAGQGGSYEIPYRRQDGEERHLLVTTTPLRLPAPHDGLLVLVSDITQRKRAEAELERLALHDALTGLPNRALLLDRISGALTRRRRHGGVIALLLLDVDQFHSVNDSVGPDGGDDLLRQFTERLERTVRAGDTVARLGSDDFAVLTEELENENEAALLAERLLHALAEPVHLPSRSGRVEVVVTASIGVAVTMADALRPEDLLQRGELAMHRAKVRGRACHEVLSDAGEQQAVDRLRVVNELRTGLRRGEVVLHYQPLVELASGRLVGAEALARWQHPERGLLGPEEFIGLAEESGLIRELGARVLRAACTEAARPDFGQPSDAEAPLQIAVNLSTQQLADPGLSDLVASVLADSGLAPHRLMLEVTETALLADTTAALQELQGLRRLGVQLALDDFGTGFSSLTYLKRFPLHELKIDRSFVSELAVDTASYAIVASVIGLARAIGLSVVAEGVETEQQRRGLLQLGCTLGQGYLFGRPVPADQFPRGTRPADPTGGS